MNVRQWQKQLISMVLVLALCISSYPGLILSGEIVYAADEFAGGDGTAGNPFRIESADQLNNIRDYLDSHFTLNQDIDMSSFDAEHPWVPIGDETAPFTGGLDGGHFRISNLSIFAPSSEQPAGLFGVTEGPASYIRNLVIEAVEVRGNDYVGILAGKNSSTIHNVGVEGSVYGDNFVGGLTGASADSNISNSYATVSINGYNDVGGLSGQVDNGVVSYSYSAGDVNGTIDVGGLIGKQEDNNVSYSYSSVNVVGCEDIGGLIGDNGNSRVENSFAAGTVTGSCVSGYAGDTVGGLVGDNSDGHIEFSYAIGRVIGHSPVGALVGISGSGYVNGNFYDRETTGQEGDSGQGLTSDEMKDRTNYTGWDFATDWDIQSPHHSGYPYLRGTQAFVTYAGNGTDDGSEAYSSHSYLPGSFVEIQDISRDWTKAGHRFYGWNTEADGDGQAYRAQETIELSGNLLLYADWKQPDVPALATPENDQYTNSGSPLISGTAEGGVPVVVILDGSEAATVTAADNGSWSWTPTGGLAEGLHTVSVGVEDSAGNPTSLSAESTFTVDTVPPVITLLGDASITLTAGTAFVDPGTTVTDAEDDIPVTITGNVNHHVPGTYTLQYDATDTAGNEAVPATRTVRIIAPGSSGGYQPSDNANLARLTIKAGEDELALTPAFAAGTTRYKAETTADEVTIEAAPSDSRAAVTLNQANLAGPIQVALSEGDNNLVFKVKAESGVLQTYNLTIHRLAEAPVCTFRDIKGHWAESSICEALEIGIVEGLSDMTFQPQTDISRVEFAAMLLRTLGIHAASSGSGLSFTDRNQIPAWAKDVVSTAVENGILQGYPDRTLRPMHRVTRAEMVVMMAKAMKWEIGPGSTGFADDADIPDWAKGYVHGAEQRELVSGREGNRFSPADSATRAEATALLLRLWHTYYVRNSEAGE